MTRAGHEILARFRTGFLQRNRLRLMALVALTWPGMAHADSCAQMRPGWDGTPATAISEAIALASMPLSLILVLISALALRFRSQWGGLAAVAGWSVLISYIVFWSDQSARFAAAQQGCVASPALFIALVAAICLAIVIYTAPAKGRPS
jgi:hypothetical protein